jgi:hypothetical protein
MTSRRRKNVRAFTVAVVITLVLGACAGDEAGASQGTTKLANPTTGPAETGPAETGPPPARASAAPDAVNQRRCSAGAKARLEVTDIGHRFKARFEVHSSPPGHLWNIRMWRHPGGPCCEPNPIRIFRGAREASDSGDFAVVQLAEGPWLVVSVKAKDSATGERCTGWADWRRL